MSDPWTLKQADAQDAGKKFKSMAAFRVRLFFLFQFLHDILHQIHSFLDRGHIEGKLCPGSAEEFRQGYHPTQRKRFAVGSHRAGLVGARIAKDLHRAQLRQAVFYIVKRYLVDVQFAMPAGSLTSSNPE